MPTTDDDKKQTADDTPRFTVEELRERSGEFLGHDSHVVDGAFAGVGKTRQFTVSDAKDKIRKWLKTPETSADETKE